MQTTQPATDIGAKDNANGVCHLLSDMGQQYVAELQKQLVHELGDSIWCMPASALHVTLCEIMQAKPYPEDKELLFQRNKIHYEDTLKEVLSDIEPIKVIFDRIEVSPQAIIIRSSDDHAFDAIREKLAKLLPLPEQTKQPPTIVHSSIARFTKEVDVRVIEQVISKLKIDFQETIAEFQLIHNGSPHMLDYEVATRFPLSVQ